MSGIVRNPLNRRTFIGGSDARIIMGDDQDRLRLWREKRDGFGDKNRDKAIAIDVDE